MRSFVVLVSSIVSANAFSTAPSLPTWSDLEKLLPTSSVALMHPAVFDAQKVEEATLKGKTVLWRDRNGWCPYAERAWLALEVKCDRWDSNPGPAPSASPRRIAALVAWWFLRSLLALSRGCRKADYVTCLVDCDYSTATPGEAVRARVRV